jgi:hypothetical protein
VVERGFTKALIAGPSDAYTELLIRSAELDLEAGVNGDDEGRIIV